MRCYLAAISLLSRCYLAAISRLELPVSRLAQVALPAALAEGGERRTWLG